LKKPKLYYLTILAQRIERKSVTKIKEVKIDTQNFKTSWDDQDSQMGLSTTDVNDRDFF